MKPMWSVALLASMILNTTLTVAAEPKADNTKQITNSIGMKLTLVPSGEFMMGSKESAEETDDGFSGKTTHMLRIPRRVTFIFDAGWPGHSKLFPCGSIAAASPTMFPTVPETRSYSHPDAEVHFLPIFIEEHPYHHVRITKPFYLGTYHVTRGQFRRFVDDTGYKTDAEKGNGTWGWNSKTKRFEGNEKYSWRDTGFEQTDEHPVVCVSWNDAEEFCKWLSGKEGKTYRLPTEAEWEYACRAGTTTRYYSGDDPETLAKVGNVADATYKAKFPECKYTIKASDGYVFTSPVGSFKPNAFGLYDMHGNARQWCSDWGQNGHYGKSPVDDPIGSDRGEGRVLRGSSWFNLPCDSRSASRVWCEPFCRGVYTGFRVARTH